ncbi:ORF6N domain-containing protein [Chromohalobacter sp. HP20-39]|uniref:ORF6N domain-containing protein n=1 Tax=Chromohalobacter sp. HP20-39 TaxID=3079306 RepID=UPI00294B0A90|nr:ORF6N domain-containing protein [Chromohalobacter sp. HP20-39]MDV6318827.1 ORF6N domain-containing protein [Chromohalobacter sp. HP20-39]
MNHSITTVTPSNVPSLTYDGKPVVTTAVLAQLYGTESKYIQNNHKRNDVRFEHGKHYYKVEGRELKELKKQPSLRGLVSKMVAHLILWTERGAARHAKMLETDQAWDVFEALEDHYFGKFEPEANNQALPSPLSPTHQRSIQRAIARRAKALPKDQQRTAFSRIYSHLKDRFEVGSYKDLPDDRFTEALGAVESVSLDGDFLPRPEALPGTDPDSLTLNSDEVANLVTMCHHTKWMCNRWQRELGPALQTLGSHHANDCHGHIVAAAKIAHSMQRKAGVLPPRA